MMIIGEFMRNLTRGPIISVPHVSGRNYIIKGDVTLNNTIIVKDQDLDFDCGTDNVQGCVSSRRLSPPPCVSLPTYCIAVDCILDRSNRCRKSLQNLAGKLM